VTTFEVELEREKRHKIAQIASRGAAVAIELGQDPDSVHRFLAHYFRHVDPLDLEHRSAEELLGLVESHYRLAMSRPVARATVAVRPPRVTDGESGGGATVVQIVTDDRPFLVDSVTMEVLRQGWTIREIFHPQFLVRRDLGGALHGVVSAADAGDPTVRAESWMHLEILPPTPTPDRSDVAPPPSTRNLEQGLLEVLRLVEEAVQDWTKMVERATETLEALQDRRVLNGHADEAPAAVELLHWLVDHHFTFLGYREYEVSPEGTFSPVSATGLGMLRADRDAPDAFHARPLPGRPLSLMVITKDDHKSRVHRPAYLDYVAFRAFDAQGRLTGERRFLGLFASSAYSEAVRGIPVLRQKAAEVLRRSGYDEHSHGGKAILEVLDTYPRDELFQASVDELAPIVEKVAHLKERRQVRLFVRRDPYGRYVSCLVFLPRDRYTTAVRLRMQEVLRAALDGAAVDYTARVSESVLARLHVVVRVSPREQIGSSDVRSVERELTLATRTWDDECGDLLAGGAPRGVDGQQLAVLAAGLPEAFKEDFTPQQALPDLTALSALTGEQDMSLALYVPDRDDEAHLRLKIFRREASLSLSKVLPHLTLLGVDVIDERPYELLLADDQRAYIYDFGVRVPGGASAVASRWTARARQQFLDAFIASYSGQCEPDGFQALVLAADLTWRQVTVLRAIGRYLRQLGSTYSQSYLASALGGNVDLARRLVALFELRFDPRLELDRSTREARTADLVAQVDRALTDVASLDHDRIVRSYLAVISATLRTNAFQPRRPTLALKLAPRQIPDVPEPRPAYEIFTYSPRVEGVHLRFGAVARGGLRWSDRAEDFRTEVLGLVKAQMVKNTVIVPVGAKGGFYVKRLPDPAVDREAWLSEGLACYRLFVASLLDLTDNLVGGQLVAPPDVVRYDADDPYLVVAADKGTATFSDHANAISTEAGFWLGDAFASGGSAGYDHKGMGITARGAWESVRRHFREQGRNPQTEDFTCVGIGDMSGDVFGNGMLLSRRLRLVAAFDHRHVFVDPTPDPHAGFAERERLFALPRSSWADYDQTLISAGGGVYPRSLKTIAVTPQMRTALGLPADVPTLSPAELISACLRAPVDLLWNGGIGTYVKATAETHAEVGDKANDGVRVNGAELRARCVGEGGNLGLTQLGRIEYAAAGGRINTDFLDNSAGVDTSDHEVNIKILLAAEVTAGRLSTEPRDELLASMTDEVAQLVLAHNYDQNLALANAVAQAPAMIGVHEDWMQRLADRALLNREIEFLPSSEETELRRSGHRGLTSPELAVLLAYTKITLKTEILESDLPDDPHLTGRLVTYFPSALEPYREAMREHRLHREIVTTVVVNEFVNAAGITCFHRLSAETGASAAELIRAHLVAREVFGADRLEAAIRALDHAVDAQVQTRLRLEVRTLVERGTRWLVDNRRRPLDVGATVAQLGPGVREVQDQLAALLRGREHEAYERRRDGYAAEKVPPDLAAAAAALPAAYAALAVVRIAHRIGVAPEQVARTHFLLAERLGLDRLLNRILTLPREDRWQAMARAALRDDLHSAQAALTAAVLARTPQGPAEEAVAQWLAATPPTADAVRTLRSICAGRPDLARASVGLRVVRGLLPEEL